MLDDGLEFEKEIRTINIYIYILFFVVVVFLFFVALPPFPLSGSVDPPENSSEFNKGQNKNKPSGERWIHAV